MYDGSAGFDLEDAVYLGNALHDSGFAWYEEPMREFSITAYKWLGERVRIPLLLGEVTDGAHMSAGDFLATGVATSLRTSTFLRVDLPELCELRIWPMPITYVQKFMVLVLRAHIDVWR